MYKQNKVLLEQTENYPKYLRKAYQGAEFQIKKAFIQDNSVVIAVKVNFPYRQQEIVLLLKKDDSGGWQVFSEISDR